MSERSDETPAVTPESAPVIPAGPVPKPAPARGGSGIAGLALLVALVAAAAGGYAAWRVLLMERGEGNARAELQQRLDAMDTRLAENERRSARNNELAATLRDGLTQNDRLRERMREDLLSLSDRSARAESMLAEIVREQRDSRSQLRGADAALAVAQADVRLRLFDDREGALAALAVAESSIGSAPGAADLRQGIAEARAALAAAARPTRAAVLGELAAVEQALDAMPLRPPRDEAESSRPELSWWARQFERLDHLVTIRRLDDGNAAVAPTRDAVRRALERARLATLERDEAELPRALTDARESLAACCDDAAAAQARAALDRLVAVDWQAPVPDLQPLRQRLEMTLDADAAGSVLPPSGDTPDGILSDRDGADGGARTEDETP